MSCTSSINRNMFGGRPTTPTWKWVAFIVVFVAVCVVSVLAGMKKL
jgi:hypothetical protein